MSAPAAPLTATSNATTRPWLRSLRRPAPAVVLGLLVLAVTGRWLAPYDPNGIDLDARLQSPSGAHLFGTDQFGRDVLSRVLQGAQVSLTVALAGTGLALLLGVVVGGIAAYIGRWVDGVLMRVVDVILAFPYIILALALAWVIGPSMSTVMIVIAVIKFPQFSRVTRAAVLEVRRRNFVAAAELIGQRDITIMLRHVLPNGLGTTIVYTTLAMGTAINTEAALSFLGVGLPPPTASWGSMLADSQGFLGTAPWLFIFPGLAVTISILAFNMWGDQLRDQMDPRSARILRPGTR